MAKFTLKDEMTPTARARRRLLWIICVLIMAIIGIVLVYSLLQSKGDAEVIASQNNVPESPSLPGSTEIPQSVASIPEPNYRYKVPSKNPLAGQPFDYSNVVRGTIPDLGLSNAAGTGILVDLDTHKVLWAKDEKRGVPIASMAKLMTALLLMEELEERPELSLETIIPVTVEASKVGGTQVWLDPKESFSYDELLKSMMICSANDSCFLVAQSLSGGNIPAFVAKMNRRAAELGMAGTNYVNTNGLPGDGGEETVSSAEGYAFLAERILEYPQIMKWAGTWRESFRQTGSPHWVDMINTNKLLNKCAGVDGLKTGYIKKAGFCQTTSCLRGGKRLIAVVTGFQKRADRDQFITQLLDWGYARAAALEQ